jgi:O-acetylhomoserine (thiol)-lyase
MPEAERTPGFATLSIHAGAKPDPTTGARVTPIYQTTSFVFDDVDHAAALFGLQTFGNIYTRIGNPTNAVLEERVAALEGGTAGLAVASGHAAQVVVMHCLMQPGDEFVASKKLYGGSINQFNHSIKNFGWNVVWADPDDLSSFEKAVSPKTKCIFIESIANPGGIIVDIEAIAKIARRGGVPLIVDNTLATPYLCKPIDYGADIIVHSLTKFLGGHGNSIGGLIVDGGTFNWSRHKKYPMHYPARDLRQLRLRDRLPRARAARPWSGSVAFQRLPGDYRHRNSAVAHAAALRQCAGRRRMAGEATRGRLGQLSGAAWRQVLQTREEIFAERRRSGLHLRT